MEVEVPKYNIQGLINVLTWSNGVCGEKGKRGGPVWAQMVCPNVFLSLKQPLDLGFEFASVFQKHKMRIEFELYLS